MLKERIPEGTQVLFEGMECRILKVVSDSCCRMTMPVSEGEVRLFPIYMRGRCIFHTTDGIYSAEGEITERYKSKNQYVMAVRLQTGLYQLDEQQELWAACHEEAVLEMEGQSGSRKNIIVTAIGTEGLFFTSMETEKSENRQTFEANQNVERQQYEKKRQMDALNQPAVITLKTNRLEGMICGGADMAADPEDGSTENMAEQTGYFFGFGEQTVEISKKITEYVLLTTKM